MGILRRHTQGGRIMAAPGTRRNRDVTEASPAAPVPTETPATEATFSLSDGLVRLLAQIGASIIFTSYESGLLYMLGRRPDGGAHLHQSVMAKPMGICVESETAFTLSAGFQVMRFRSGLAAHERVNNLFDACYVARETHFTGQLDAHDIGIDRDGRPLFINTRFNCLATIDPCHSFREIWRPPFISALVDEDRCHLNGLAMDQGEAAYVTAVSRSNTIDGWRDRRHDGGVVIDVRTGAVVCEGLSMPHSPRMHNGELWLLNSGTGELGVVEGASTGKGRFVPRVFCPGFARGLAFHQGLAFVGLSKPRYKRFEGLALDQKLADADSEPWCGIHVIDLAKGRCAEWFRIDGGVRELFDVAVLKGPTCPMSVGPGAPEITQFITHAASTLESTPAI